MVKLNRHGIPIEDSTYDQGNFAREIYDKVDNKVSRKKLTKKKGPRRRRPKKSKTTWRPRNTS